MYKVVILCLLLYSFAGYAGCCFGKNDDFGRTELMYSIITNSIMIPCIIKANSHVINQQDSEGNTALMYAAVAADLETIMLLLKEGADPFICNNQHQTALLYVPNKYKPRARNLVRKYYRADVLRGYGSIN